MRHLELFEIHDHRWCPTILRNLFTDALQAIWVRFDTYRPVVPLLHGALKEGRTNRVIDLCSGAGGPWPRLTRHFEEQDYNISVLLTDIKPNIDGFERASSKSKYLSFYPKSISALQVPADLNGFRTMFSSFHHFPPGEAHRILRDAVTHCQGIAIFESANRDMRVVLAVCLLPLIVLLITPTIRPFGWPQIFWTYIVPLVPFMVWFDGIMSCLRAYSKDELIQMSKQLEVDNYCWQADTTNDGLMPITYLIGYPTRTD
jgi:hypothetical protein